CINPKSECRIPKQCRISKKKSESRLMEPSPAKPYDLEERTLFFAQHVRALIRKLPRTVCNREDAAQLAKSSGSVGANYIEANECLGKKDFLMHIKISRKESKESRFHLRLLFVGES